MDKSDHISYWEQREYFKKYDFVVVGAGLVGLQTSRALLQKYPHASIIVLEKSLFPKGASTRNAGFLCFGSISELEAQRLQIGQEACLQLLEQKIKGLELLKESLQGYNVGLEMKGGYELFRADQDKELEAARASIGLYNEYLEKKLGPNNFVIQANPDKKHGTKGFTHAIYNAAEGQIDSSRAIWALQDLSRKSGIRVLRGVEIKSIQSNKVLTDFGDITYDACVVCTNAFGKELLPELEIVPGRGQVLITKEIKNLKLRGTYHLEKGFYYFRDVGDRILLGGGRNLDLQKEETTKTGINPKIFEKLVQILHEELSPNDKIEVEKVWSGIMCFSKSGLPIVKEVRDNVFYAGASNGMGVAIGSYLAQRVVAFI